MRISGGRLNLSEITPDENARALAELDRAMGKRKALGPLPTPRPGTPLLSPLREAWAAFLNIDQWNNPLAITFTLPQEIVEVAARQNFGHFLNRLNRAVYKNAFRRKRKRCQCIPILEGDKKGGVRTHYHAVIETPSHLDPDQFRGLIEQCWGSTRWASPRSEVKPAWSGEWLAYLLKLRTKNPFGDGYASFVERYGDCIDASNLYISKNVST